MEGSPEGLRDALLERDQELEQIGEVVAGAVAGRGGGLLVEGEPGIGKSALLAVAVQEASRLGAQTLLARGAALEQSIGYGVVRQLFELPVVRGGDEARRRLLSGSASVAVAALNLAPPLPDVGSPKFAPVSEAESQHGLYWLVANLAEQAPVALVIDDAHWCDQATLRWLLFLARRLERLPVALLIAVRSGEPHRVRELLAMIATEPLLATVSLAALSEPATGLLLTRAFAGEAEVDERFGRACHGWTGGNPFLVTSLAAELVAEGIEPAADAVGRLAALHPRAVLRSILLRLSQLPPDAVKLAQAASIFGSGARLREVTELAGLDGDHAREAADRLVAAHVLDISEQVRFVHPLIASVIYEEIPPAHRAHAHRRAADILASEGEPTERVAAHLLRCHGNGDRWVLGKLRSAAGRELARGAADAAVALLTRALAEPPDSDEQGAVLHELGTAETLAALPDGVSHLQRALVLASPGEQRAQVALSLGRALAMTGRAREAVSVLEPEIEALVEGDRESALMLESVLLAAGRTDMNLRDLVRHRLLGIREAAERAETPAERLLAVHLAFEEAMAGTSSAHVTALARLALAGDTLLGGQVQALEGSVAISMLALCDELDEAERCFSHGIANARARGAAAGYAALATLRALSSYWRGALADSEADARDALRIAREVPALATISGYAAAHLALALVERDQVGEAAEILNDEIARLPGASVPWRADLDFALGRVHAIRGQLEVAREAFLSCGERQLAAGFINPAWIPWRSEAALANLMLGERDLAQARAREELALARRFGAQRPIGMALHAVGITHGGEGGLASLREAAGVLANSPSRLEYIRALVSYGGALRRAGRRAEAGETLERALGLAQHAQATRLESIARVELRAAGVRKRSVIRDGVDALTAAELRVCRLAAAGHSNPEIAQMLFVTRATVESHLHSAYRKLDISSRRDLATAIEPGALLNAPPSHEHATRSDMGPVG